MKNKSNILKSPYNLSHPDSKCPAREGRRHKLKMTARVPSETKGIYNCASECEHCHSLHYYIEDYNVLAGIF